jgi:glycosyltransferase involved in cell wall biosynthesis
MDFVILIPAYQPDDKLTAFARELKDAGLEALIVDDGSDPEKCGAQFAACEELGYTVVHHEQNRGKGAALRTGLVSIAERFPDTRWVITADSDGQHTLESLKKVADACRENPEALVIGGRFRDKESIPFRSRLGNSFTRGIFKLATGLSIHDTQTGLRGIPAALFPRLLTVRGDRFEYETNMLLELSRRGVKLLEVPIETVYEDDNSESHFRPVRDSLRIYRFVILYALSSLSGSLADLLVFYIARRLLEAGPVADGNMTAARAVLIATVIARAVSSFLNFNLNNKMVFNGRGDYGKMLLRYYCLAVPVMLASAGLVALLSGLAGTGASVLTTCIKFVVDVCLFFLSFRIQQTWVFREEKENDNKPE